MKKSVVILILLFEITTAAGQGLNIDSLKNLLAKTKVDTTRIMILSRLCNELARYEPDSAIQLAQEGLKQAKQIHFQKGEANLTMALGVAWAYVGDYANAIKWLSSVLAYADTTRELEIKRRTYVELSLVYRDQGDYAEAFKYITLTEAYLQHIPRESCLVCRGVFHISASIYLEKNQLDSAKKYIDKAFSYPPSFSKGINASAFDVAGRIQAGLKNYDSALLLYRKAIQGFLELKRIYKGLPRVYNALASLLNTMGLRDSAFFYLHKSLAISQQKNFGKEILDATTLLAKVHEFNQVDSALHYYKQAMRTRDILYDQEKQRQIASYKFDIELQQQQAANAQAQFRNQVKIYALLGLALVLVTVGFILWRANDRRKKSFVLLEKQKAETDTQKDRAEQTVKELKATQAQLIQSEKMASLGELTAGIAHEIQNPLNFVNNFSDVNTELIEELKEELATGDKQAVEEIANNIKDNQEKINFHGKRADAIVKGMLLHSRGRSGEKEVVDVNALCDEYLRLAFHGFRAKDKSFSANFNTVFDPNLPKVNTVRQDIGRVLLNLINNAFYAVREKAKNNLDGYEPTVSIYTKKLNARPDDPVGRDKVEIRVNDNGDGIPDEIRDKIFQPFFTTKPTGQGAGLGLSLSYDIVKAHGGELSVEANAKEGTTFLVKLPI